MSYSLKNHTPQFTQYKDKNYEASAAYDLWEHEEKFLKVGKNRAVLLAGEPGVGKSNAAKYIASLTGNRTLRIKASTLEDADDIGIILSVLKPSTVIVDDIDRASQPGSFLDELDQMRLSTQFIIATCNYTNDLDPAVRRRFDRVLVVDKLDPAVVKRIRKCAPVEAQESLLKLPVVYVMRYLDCLETVGEVEAATELEHLIQVHKDIKKSWESRL